MPGTDQVLAVRRRAEVDVPWFRAECLASDRPVVITDLVERWPALQRWTWQLLADHYGHLRVVVVRGGERAKVRLADYLDYVLQPREYEVDGPPPYLKDWHVEEDCPELLNDVVLPPYMRDWLNALPDHHRPRATWLYIGPDGSRSPLHRDIGCTHAWLAVVHGTKHWRLVPPSAFAESEIPGNGVLSLSLFDEAVWRQLGESTDRYQATLGPGDLIFVPAGWFHQVINEGPTWAVTRNYVDDSNFARVWDLRLSRGTKQDLEFLESLADAFVQLGRTPSDRWGTRWQETNLHRVRDSFPQLVIGAS